MKRIFHIAENFVEAEKWDLRQNAEMTPEARLDAVEFLREQCWVAAGVENIPRIQKKGRIVEAKRSRGS
jgi:hypothetical protein